MTKEDILNKIKADNLVMSSVPKKTKEEFTQFAQEEFADNYGASLKYIWDMYKLFVMVIENFDSKLDYIIASLETNPGGIKTLSGKKLKGGGIDNGKNR